MQLLLQAAALSQFHVSKAYPHNSQALLDVGRTQQHRAEIKPSQSGTAPHEQDTSHQPSTTPHQSGTTLISTVQPHPQYGTLQQRCASSKAGTYSHPPPLPPSTLQLHFAATHASVCLCTRTCYVCRSANLSLLVIVMHTQKQATQNNLDHNNGLRESL